MKTFPTLAVLLHLVAGAGAQEKISAEQMHKIAPMLLENSARLKSVQLKINADAEKADGMKANDAGLIVLPDKDLTVEKLARAGKEIVPLGQLYLRGIAPAKDGKPADNDRMHILMIEDSGKAQRVWLCLLGAQKRDGKLELVLYGSEKIPLLRAELRQHETSQDKDTPITVSVEKREDKSADVTLGILGKYQATFVIMKQEG
jgi:hypothetical protein